MQLLAKSKMSLLHVTILSDHNDYIENFQKYDF